MSLPGSEETKGRQANLAPGERIEGLDVWRVALMLGGLLLHGSLWQPPQPLFTVVGLVSSAFRMGCFFALSGLLCGMALRRRTFREWLVRRLVQIGLPMSFGWGVLCPSVLMLTRWYPHAPVPLMFDWHHIWFLVALLMYAPATVALYRLDDRRGLIGNFATMVAAGSPAQLLLRLALASFVLMVWTRFLVYLIAPKSLVPMLGQAPNISGYLPLYLFGLAMARSPVLGDTLWRSVRPAAAILAVVGALYTAVMLTAPMSPQTYQMHGLLRMVAAALCPPAAFALIYRSAVAMSKVHPLIKKLCDASLTIYLLHLPLLLALNAALAPLHWHPYVQFLVAIVMAGGLSYVTHVCIVRQVPLLSLIMNGRTESWPRLMSFRWSMLRART